MCQDVWPLGAPIPKIFLVVAQTLVWFHSPGGAPLFGGLVSIRGSRMVYLGLSQNKLQCVCVCVHGDEGACHSVQQCDSVMCFL